MQIFGVWITTNSNYNKAQQSQANQGKKAIFALQRLFAKLKYPPITIFGVGVLVGLFHDESSEWSSNFL